MTLRWSELESAAEEAFRIWTSRSDRRWARDTWLRLERSGFCDFEDERERLIVIGRWLALSSIYRDWCAAVCEEVEEDSPADWVKGLEIHDIHLGQLMATEPLSDDPGEARSEALSALMEEQRDSVVEKLKEVYGDPVLLFMSFWKSANASGVGDDDPDADEQAAEALNDPTPENLSGWSWLEEGCPQIRPV